MTITIPEKIIQRYFTKKRVYRVVQTLDTVLNGAVTSLQTTFDFELYCHKQKENTLIIVIQKGKAATLPYIENNFLELLGQLEDYTYPIAVEVSQYGDFMHIINHKNWLSNWNKRTQVLMEEFGFSEEAVDLQKRYYDVVKDPIAFVQNKFSEPFWNIFFFTPPFDRENKTAIAAQINWNIKTIGNVVLEGTVQRTNSGSKTIATHFEATQPPDTTIIEKLKSVARFQNTDEHKQTMKVSIDTEFDLIYNRLKHKSAIFEYKVADRFSYIEKIEISLKKVIDK